MNPPDPHRRSSWLGMIAGTLMTLTGKQPKSKELDLKKHDFSTSTQRKGIRFSERIRDTFRHRWLK